MRIERQTATLELEANLEREGGSYTLREHILRQEKVFQTKLDAVLSSPPDRSLEALGDLLHFLVEPIEGEEAPPPAAWPTMVSNRMALEIVAAQLSLNDCGPVIDRLLSRGARN